MPADAAPDFSLETANVVAAGGMGDDGHGHALTIVDDGSPQAYLNGDERAGANVDGKPSYTIDRAAIQLTGFNPLTFEPAPGWGGVAGQAYEVSYGFRSTRPFNMPSDTDGFQRFNSGQIFQAEQAMLAWSDVANITFRRVGEGDFGEQAYTNSAEILFGNYSTGEKGAAAFANYPGAREEAGDVWVNINAGTNAIPSPGNYGAQVLIHEIGHAIGLAHPGRYNAEANVTITYRADAEYYEDTRQYTVMSYFSETNTGGNYRGLYAAAPQLDDIRGAQVEYGVNMTTRTGDTVYGFNSNTERSWYTITSSSQRPIFAVWDAGGHDTLDFSRFSQNALIDLREGNFSNVGGLTGNVAIAQGAKIEDAIGGFGADTLYGNALANVLTGNAGADSIFAGEGDDLIDGGAGESYLRGEGGDDSIIGGAAFDDIQGNTGRDTEYGDAGDDFVVGGKDNDALFGDAGADLVYGNLGDDTCVGGDDNDIVRGGQGDDSLFGGAGDDFVSGDRGDDVVAGGTGADLFHAFTGAGIDVILDFRPEQGDRVLLDPGTEYTVAQVGGDTWILLGSIADRVVLEGVDMSTLAPGWIFGA